MRYTTLKLNKLTKDIKNGGKLYDIISYYSKDLVVDELCEIVEGILLERCVSKRKPKKIKMRRE